MPRHEPKKHSFIAAAILIAVLIAGLLHLRLHPVWAWLIAFNLATFILYGFDKRHAVVNKGRITEIVLHTLALLGGTPAAFLAQTLFRHKRRKLKFMLVFFLIFALQLAAALYIWHLTHK